MSYRTMRRQRIVGVINRTDHPLEAVDDGIVIVIKPGYRKLPNGNIVGAGPHGEPAVEHLPQATANRAMDQNKLRGSVNPDDQLDCVFLIGRLNTNDDLTYVEDNQDPDAELFDRSLLPEARRAEKISTGVGRRNSRRDKHSGVIATRSGLVDVGVADGSGGLSGRTIADMPTTNRPFEAPDL